MVYGIGNKGAAYLKQSGYISFRNVSWGEKNCSIRRIFLEHALLVSDIMAAIELACRKDGIRLLTERELIGREKSPKWHVNLNGRRLGIIPDRAFALEYVNQNGLSERAIYFLEADRGTMPVVRTNLSQTSFYRKLLAYEATWTQSIHQTHFGFNRFRVLTVTSSTARGKSLIEACSKLERGHGLFLFTDRNIMDNSNALLRIKLQTGREGEYDSLF